jgi:hypothetical protein
MENVEKDLLIRIDERVKVLGEQMVALHHRLATDFVSKADCHVRQIEHERQSILIRAESVAKIAVLITIAISLLWAVTKHV